MFKSVIHRRAFAFVTLWTFALVLAAGGCAAPPAVNRPPEVSPLKAAFWPPYPDEPRIQFLVSYLNSKEVAPSRSKMDDLVYGKEKDEALSVNKPYGVRMWNGRIYVCDIRSNCVVIFDLRNHQTLLMGKTGTETLQTPTDLAIADDGTKYVTDLGRGLVVVFDAQDRAVTVIGHKDFKPVAAAVYKDELYVADTIGKHIEVYNRLTGQLLRTVGSPGREIGQLVLPIGVAVDKEGNLYVMDLMTTRLTKFDHSGKPLVAYFGTITASVGGLVRPKHIAVDDDGIIYVVDAAFQNVQLYDQAGQILTFFGSPGNHPGAMFLPAGICVHKGDLDLFQDYIHPAFQAKQLIIVTNQFGPRRVAIYAMGQLKPGKTIRDIAASKGLVGTGVSDKNTPTTGPTELPTTLPAFAPPATEPGALPPAPTLGPSPAPALGPNPPDAGPSSGSTEPSNVPGSAVPGNTSDAIKK
jgi:hypothetical protein